MKNALIILYDKKKLEKIFLEYLIRETQKSLGEIDSITLLEKSDNNTFLFLEEVTNTFNRVVIATEDGFELIGRILSTFTNDTQIYKNGILLPSKTFENDVNSYLIKCNNALVNVLKIENLQKLPKILINQEQNRLSLFLIGKQNDSLKVENIAHLFEVDVEKYILIEDVYKFIFLFKNQRSKEHFLEQMNRYFKARYFIADELAEIVLKRLIEENKTITTAESCTGGLIASEITKYSGVSSIYHGSVVSYSNDIKSDLLGVSKKTLTRYGAVSKECVKEMLVGVEALFDSDYAIAVSGIAGPTGGTTNKPVGTVFVGIKSRKKGSNIKKLSLKGDRRYIQKSTKYWAFKLLLESDKNFFSNF